MFGLFKPKTAAIQDAKVLYSKGNYKKALSVCRKYLDTNKNDFDATNLLGDIYFHSGDKTKSLEVFKELASSTEADKYVDRSIAVTKKIIRIFPEQYDLYRKLSKLFEKKGVKAEQLKVLYELADIYKKKGFADKVIDILKEIIEIDRDNIESYKAIIKELTQSGKSQDVCKFMYYCLELSYKNKDYGSTEFFTDIAISNNCDLSQSIHYAAKFFEKHTEHAEIFKNFSIKFFEKNYDKELFKSFIKFLPYSDNESLYNKIIDLHKKSEVFDYILQNKLKDKFSEFKEIFNRIKDLPDYDFNPEFGNLAGKFSSEVDDQELLDTMLVIANRSNSEKDKLIIYNRMITVYEAQGLEEKAQRIKNLLENDGSEGIIEADETLVKNDKPLKSLDVDSYFDTGDSKEEFVLDLDGESFNSSDIELDLTSFEPSDVKATESVVDTKQFEHDDNIQKTADKRDEKTVSDKIPNETFSSDPAEGGINIDIDLGAFDVAEDENNEAKLSEHYGEDFEIHADIPEIESLEDKIEKIRTLLKKQKLSEAQQKLDVLLLDYPDDEKVKDLASEIVFYEDEDKEGSKKAVKADVEDIRSDFQKVASAIRQSINQVVSPDDYETHYDLAIAYMEMELYDDAIEELKKSATEEKRYESLFLMGECYKRSKIFDDAVNIHKLIIMDYDEKDKLLNSLYEIGSLLEEKGEGASSRKYFEKVYNLDSGFRDINIKYKKVGQDNFIDSSAKSIVDKPKKRKVSFL